MKDYVVRVTAGDGAIRAFAARVTNLVNEAQKLHGLHPVAAAALGRSMAAAAMMAVDMKGEKDVFSLIVKGDGPLGSVIVVANPNGDIKGYVGKPALDLPLNEFNKLDVSAAVGRNGKITVIKDLGLKDPYVGQTKLVSGEIAEDVAYYLTVSEQQPSAVALGVLVNPDYSIEAAGGYIIQAMPDAPDNIIDEIENKISKMEPISKLFERGKKPEEVLYDILGKLGMKENARVGIRFKCDCNRERLRRVLLGMQDDELIDIIKTDGKAELVCHYCNKRYLFGLDELKQLLEEKKRIEENYSADAD